MADMIEEFAKLIPESMLHESGAVFYSGRRAFSKPSDVYILGSNPGGADMGDTPVDASTATLNSVCRNVRFVLDKAPCNWSDYRDGCWTPKCTRTRLQLGVMRLCNILQLDPGEVPASEVVFLRSRSLPELEGKFEKLAQQCWQFHQAVIDKLEIRVVACIGKRAGEFVRQQLKAYNQVDEFTEKNKRRWESLSHMNADGLIVVTLTHASQADWTKPASDPTYLVKRALIRTDTKHRAEYLARRREFKPIRIEGEMISDTVIREREDRV